MKKSVFALMSSILVAGVALTGCGSTETASTTETPAAADKKGSAEQVLKVNLQSEPSTVDPALAEDATSGTVIRATFDGLTRLDADAKPINSVASDVKVSDDQLTYTFTLRDSKWSNGEPVTANDFVFAWLRALDAKTASSYAYQLFYIKNGRAYNEGKVKAEEVGIKALDEKTLEVTLANPTPFFLELTAFYTYFPVNQKVVEANKDWAMNADTFVSNGPFKMQSWEHKNSMVLVKNENYWDKDTVKLEKIDFSMIEDQNTELSMYDAGDLDWSGQPVSALPPDAIIPLKDSGKLIVKPKASTYYYKFNTERPPFNNAKIRKAFSYAIDRKSIADNIAQSGQIPAMNLLPESMALKPGGYFKDNDIENAKKLLAEGMKELNLTTLPPITLTYNTSERHKKIAEAVQDQWKQNLGVDVKLENKEFKVFLDDQNTGNYMIARAGWNADFNDPINFLEMFYDKKGGNNDTLWENPKYRELLDQVAKETDAAKRKELFTQAEAILMDEMPIAPVFTDVNAWVQNDKLKGVQVDPLSFIDFKWAYKE
ncbi:peptide ABC transporter substrate-binding protein [Brevibacillus dissolubilis]|uniref:peptide ABC transporter substrate-binding protein n=1 Tax=Brevibacillus dissolubilis TaxID=1844116 RepID=UPI001116AA7A|nr:peptide ABC transporter substrate-binding protein [Brevibacillus dissolubilis]